MNSNKPPQLTRQAASRNLNKGAGAHLTRQDASRNLNADAAPMLTRQNATTNLRPDADQGVANMNSMIPKPSPRSTSTLADSKLPNSGRQNKAIGTIGAEAAKRLDTVLAAGKSDIHKESTKQLHKDRAFIYDQTKAGMFGKAKNKMMDKALSAGGALGIGSADEKKEKRTQMILEAKQLKPYQKRIKQQNPDAAKREKIASNLKKTKKGAKYVDYVGTGVSFVAPQVGAGIKIGAKATKLVAGTGSTIAYNSARKAYAKNVDDSASGDAMFDSHVAKEKADMMKNTRNKMAVSTGASLVASAGALGLDAAIDGVSEKAASAITGGYDIGKRVAKDQIKKPFKEKIRENKSELVNLMQIQKSRSDHKTRQATMSHEMMRNLANKK